MVSEPLYTESFCRAGQIGPFARMCQAAHVLGKVLAHQQTRRRSLKDTDDARALLSEARHLHNALCSLQSTLEPSGEGAESEEAGEEGASALALCASTRLLLYNMYGCNDPSVSSAAAGRIPQETEMQRFALEGIKTIASVTAPMLAARCADALNPTNATASDSVTGSASCPPGSPFVAQLLYHAATECAWFIREDHEPYMCEALEAVIRGLEAIGRRCGIGGELPAMLSSGGLERFGVVMVGR